MAGEVRRRVAVFDDEEELSLAAAGLFALQARRATVSRGRCDVLLSGGETPRRCYLMLGAEPLVSSIPWGALHLFWGDERHVPHDDPRSNYGMALRTLLRRAPLGEAQVHPVPCAGTVQGDALAYEQELRNHFAPGPAAFDLCFLGLGEDGHTASLFPGTPALRERERWVCEVQVPSQRFDRITLTAPVLNASSVIVFLVTGGAKAPAVKEVLEGERDPQRVPAQLIEPTQGRVVWLLDRDAARLLSQTTR